MLRRDKAGLEIKNPQSSHTSPEIKKDRALESNLPPFHFFGRPFIGLMMLTVDLNSTFGGLLVGTFLSAMLFGVTCSQAFYYSQNYSADRFLVKATVVALLTHETLHSAFSMHAIYHYTIISYADAEAWFEATWSVIMTLVISSLIILIVHLFYLRRVYHMSRKNIPLVALLTFLSLGHFATGALPTAGLFRSVGFTYIPRHNRILVIDTWLSLGVATDILTAASLSYYLHTSRSGIKRTDTMVNKLMVYTINNGILTRSATPALVESQLIVKISMTPKCLSIQSTTQPDKLIFMSIFQIVGNLYTNSMMATLNSRRSLSQAHLPEFRGSSDAMETFRVAHVGSASTIPIERTEFRQGALNVAQTV
ncbi:hypothetical protein GALMADRAFT_145920 [Galerina marginata CBS 339.88]|uniref:DUF6534 domain-containing protein n=1 Tax=Galerina marginata (strain CBS 339.88) TaxID=685588 RepID=A0A067SQ48_GALM3|nr:hypothetical protein GALMADRAFT_145920 [Galerina marginata CBS 339.88]